MIFYYKKVITLAAMLKIKLLLIVLCFVLTTKAQTPDTIQLVNYFGRLTPVIDGHAVTFKQLKPMLQKYPETLQAWKKARNSARISQTLLITDVAATLLFLTTKSEEVIITSLAIGVSALVTLNLHQDVRNLKLLYAVQMYNRKALDERNKVGN